MLCCRWRISREDDRPSARLDWSGLRLREAACASDDFPLWIDAPWGSVTHRWTVVGERSMCMFTRFLKFLRRLGQTHPAVIAIAPDRTW